MITCLGDMFFPEVGVAMVTLLRRLGVTVEFPEGQTCCGMPLFNSGYHGEAAAVAARTVDVFARSEHVVVPSGSCAWMVKEEYPGLLKDDPAARDGGAGARRRGRASCRSFSSRCSACARVESSFRGEGDLPRLLPSPARARGVASPRALLRGVAGVELVELPGRRRVLRLRRLVLRPFARGLVRDSRQEARQHRDDRRRLRRGVRRRLPHADERGLSRRDSRVRALHLAQVLAGRRA